jgi:hypothetical protein
MKIRGNGMGSSLALSTTQEEWGIHCRKGQKFVTGPEKSGVGISSQYLKDLLSLNTITPGVAKTLHA